ncbi:MAG: hypothetical protein LC672_00075 [Acidobacteria bacterium]|nr:hypothetical protein [Acidobacteriota bacterium]
MESKEVVSGRTDAEGVLLRRMRVMPGVRHLRVMGQKTMCKSRILLLLTLMLPLFVSTTFAQGFPWDDFKRRTLKEIVSIDAKEIQDSERENRVIFHADMLLSVIRVKYTGKSRPISKVKKEFLEKWAQTFSQNAEAYAAHYERDFLFMEGEVEYWLPVQKKVSAYFPKQLKEGEEVDIYVVRAGGVCSKKVCDWLFLVEEFQKPKAGNSN